MVAQEVGLDMSELCPRFAANMTDVESKVRRIPVGNTNILDASIYSQERRFYTLTADVFDGDGKKIGRQVLLKDIVSSEQEVADFIGRSKDFITNIQYIQFVNGGHLEDIQLCNLSVDEAEEIGLIQKPAVLHHISI